MKKLFFFLLLSLTLAVAQSQNNICVVSNTNSGWGASHNQAGPYTDPVFDVGLCTNDCVVACICGAGYGQPHMNAHFANCCAPVTPIWGTPSPANCYFNAETFWFHQTFQFNKTSCTQLRTAMAHIQGDQRFDLFINGNLIGSSTNAQWNQDFNFPLNINQLINGQNDILIKVENINGGNCFNYAFLAFCLQITSTEADPGDPCFAYNASNDGHGNFTITANANNTSPLINHEWLVYWGDNETSQPNFLGYYGPNYSSSLTFNPSSVFEGCRYFLVMHRVYFPGMPNCGACCAARIPICKSKPQGGQEPIGTRVAIDCSIFDQYHAHAKGGSNDDRSTQPATEKVIDSSIQVSPNPTQDLLNVQWANFSAGQVRVIDFNGQVLLEKNLSSDEVEANLQVSAFPVGLYIVELSDNTTGKKLTKLFTVGK